MSYTYDQVFDVLTSSGSQLRFQYELLDNRNNTKFWLTRSVTSCKVEYDYTAQIKRTAKLSMVEDPLEPIDYVNDRIRPWIGVLMPDGGWADFPQGVFLLNAPKRHYENGLITRAVDGFDQAKAIAQSTFGTGDVTIANIVIPAGTLYTDQIMNMLTYASIQQAQISITESQRQTLVDRGYTKSTARRYLQTLKLLNARLKQRKAAYGHTLHVIRSLMHEINYEDLWFDGYGVAHVHPYVEPTRDAIDHRYEVGDKSIILPVLDQTLDIADLPNVIVLVVSHPDRPVMVSKYFNMDPTSPISIPSRGRRVVYFDASLDVAGQNELDSIAKRLAVNAANIYEQVDLQTMINPMHGNRDIVKLTHPGTGIDDVYVETKWSIEMKPGGTMAHTLQRLINLDSSVIGAPDA